MVIGRDGEVTREMVKFGCIFSFIFHKDENGHKPSAKHDLYKYFSE